MSLPLVRKAVITAVIAAAVSSVASAQAQSGCDPLDPAVCLQPWPNDYFTVPDGSTATGRRLNLAASSMPHNLVGVAMNPVDHNRSDGFSPGSSIITRVPGLDTPEAFASTGAVPITDLTRYADPNQPIVVINAATGQRHPIWSELDSNPTRTEDVNLLIHPAMNFEEGARYIVSLRGLKDAAGNPLPASPAFRLYRDQVMTSDPEVEARRPHMESLFATLTQAGIARQNLYLAWDFTVASARGLSQRMLRIRDDAFRQLGDNNLADRQVQGRAPLFNVTKVTDFQPCGDDDCQDGENDRIARLVEGTFYVPCYLDTPLCLSGGRFNLRGGEVPVQSWGNFYAAGFLCNIPRVAVDGPHVIPARPSLYGHGLFGTRDSVNSEPVIALGNEHNFMFCATDWSGMSRPDVANTVTVLADLSRFPTLVDRVQQGMLNFLYLGRLMIHPSGFKSHPAFKFQKAGGAEPVIDTTELFYDGNSQGGILGGALTAVAPDYERAVLGVPGMNYSTLLSRSVDFDTIGQALFTNYPDMLQRPLVHALMQVLWDRADANGYAHHLTRDPYPNTPTHQVLLHEAFGDHQVANIATEVEARTLGVHMHQPAFDPGRSVDVTPSWGIPAISTLPFDGSALVVWDIGPLRDEDGTLRGTPAAPTTNTPPHEGVDPHDLVCRDVAARIQKAEFLKVGGHVIDVCDGRPCHAGGWAGPR